MIRETDINDVISHPDLQWNRQGLSENKDITVHLIDTLELPNATGKWKWFNISQVIDIKEVIAHPDRPWCKCGLSMNEDITLDIIESLHLPYAEVAAYSLDGWDWRSISRVIDINEVITHPDRTWNRQGLLQNKGITVDIMRCLDHQYTHELLPH